MMMKLFTQLALLCMIGGVAAFAPPSTKGSPLRSMPTKESRSVSLVRSNLVPALQAAAAMPANPFKKLPWNVAKEKQRQARRLKLERASLHRELGIAEDATYEEIVEATDALIARAGDDLKKKIKIEVAKDKILQIRLNERLAGLASASSDARAQSTFEVEGADDDESPVKKVAAEWNAPKWTQGLIVKPDEQTRQRQIRLWGGVTLLGLGFPPAQEYLGRFTWLICCAQLTFRGMPREDMGGGGLGISFNSGGGGSHRKVAWLLGVTTWIVGAILVYGLMPSWAKGQRYTASIAFTMQNLIFGVVCSYLQPYKG